MAEIRQKLAVPPSGQLRDSILVKILEREEPPSVYVLEDGTRLTARTLITEVWRVEGEYDVEGNPMYVTKAGGVITVTSPVELRRKSQ